ncbi:MAG: hypothetical protein JO111_16770 [Caulobacteraceae bacterium]|nr:hypothetical protein [Caulobacteraceae bacterium]
MDGVDLIRWIAPVGVAIVLIALGSLLPEPPRRRFSAIFLAGAGAAYLSGGFGVAEFAFCATITILAYVGLENYWAVALGWLLHSGWDIAHHLWGHPIIPFAATSSLGCAICDPVLALWYAAGAPTIWRLRSTVVERS